MKKIISLMLVVALLFSVFSFNQVGVVAKTKKPTKVEKLFKGNKLPKTRTEMEKYIKKIKIKIYVIKKIKKKNKLVKESVYIFVHKKLVGKFKSAFKKMFKLKFPMEADMIDFVYIKKKKVKFYAGCYFWRKISGSNVRSQHSYGVAIDINPFNAKKLKSNYFVSSKIINIWERLGFEYYSSESPHSSGHFEYK